MDDEKKWVCTLDLAKDRTVPIYGAQTRLSVNTKGEYRDVKMLPVARLTQQLGPVRPARSQPIAAGPQTESMHWIEDVGRQATLPITSITHHVSGSHSTERSS
ncbi:hypothetical protein BS47DRAFT_1354765 [Hydnum rufescens UP504]|uniref:Uncharacterized protein n=1 Tax=Hydnum rufescens UP504 TaxID=1448309 RepID=A0A9P6AF85_9AGAM|nr:hypothetical protein BS47DRAFT_1354765 [Hydnum rufescens UP504]